MTYTDSFSPAILRRFSQAQREVIQVALEIGWLGKIMADGGMRMVPPEGLPETIKPIYFPQKRMNSNALDSIKRTLARAARERGLLPSPPVETAFGMIHVVETEAKAASMGVPALAIESAHNYVQEEADLSDDHVVSERPFLARASVRGERADLYASSTTIERTWSSGKVDYRCAECDYTSHKAKSVRNHYRVHGKAVVDRTVVASSPDVEPIYDTAVRRLEREITEALARVDLPDDMDQWGPMLARCIVQTRRERREAMEHDDPEPLTPERVIARIRSIVMPEMLANESRLTEEVRSLTERVAQAEQERTSALASARQAQETLDTLVALVSDIKRGGNDADSAGNLAATGS